MVRRRRSWAIRVLARVNNASSRVWGFIVDILRVTRKIFLSRRILSLTEFTEFTDVLSLRVPSGFDLSPTDYTDFH